MEKEVPGLKAMEMGKPSWGLNPGRMSTAGDKERAASAEDAGEIAACPGLTMRPQDFVCGLDAHPRW